MIFYFYPNLLTNSSVVKYISRHSRRRHPCLYLADELLPARRSLMHLRGGNARPVTRSAAHFCPSCHVAFLCVCNYHLFVRCRFQDFLVYLVGEFAVIMVIRSEFSSV